MKEYVRHIIGWFFVIAVSIASAIIISACANPVEPDLTKPAYIECDFDQTHTMTPYIFGINCDGNIQAGDTIVIRDLKWAEYDRSG